MSRRTKRQPAAATPTHAWRQSLHWLVAHARRAHATVLTAPAPLIYTAWGCVALAASSDLANTFDSPRRGGPLVAALLALALALAFTLFIAGSALRQNEHRDERRPSAHWPSKALWLRWLLYPALAWALLTALGTPALLARGAVRALTTQPARYGSDDLYDNHYNALLVLHGQNPYVGNHLPPELRYFGDLSFTPIARGRFADLRHYPSQAAMDAVMRGYLANPHITPVEIDPATTHSYPAGAFLVDIPSVWAGIPSVAFAQIILLLGLFVLIVWATPRRWRLVTALLLLSAADGVRQVTGADFEIWPLALLASAWLTRERRTTSALLLGAACAIKQTAWLAAPFYLIWVWRAAGWREALRRSGLALAFFILVNAPWIIASPRAWLASILLPVSLPLLPDGSGVIGLALTGLTPLAPHLIYSILELGALAVALLWYWRVQPHLPFAGLILPLTPLFFAWRSSERYFTLLPILATLALALTLHARPHPQTPPPSLPGKRAGG